MRPNSKKYISSKAYGDFHKSIHDLNSLIFEGQKEIERMHEIYYGDGPLKDTIFMRTKIIAAQNALEKKKQLLRTINLMFFT